VAEIELTSDELVVHVTGVDRALALKTAIRVPFAHVVGARPGVDEDAAAIGLLRFGTHLPGVIKAGTFFARGKRFFWDVHHRDRAISIRLRDERYDEVVVEVADPEGTVRQLEDRIPRERPA
jgi:hypothetical protein